MGVGLALNALDISRRRFALAAACAAAASLGFIAILVFHPVSDQLVTAIDDIGEAVAALLAAASCAWAARRTAGRLRVAWTLLALSAGSWGIGQVIWSVYEVGMGVAVPFPSAADVGFLLAVPLAIAGVLAFTTSPRGTSTRWRLMLDGLIIALSLAFIAWAAGLSVVLADGSPGAIISAAYPIGDILIGTVLILAIRRATDQQQGRMLLLLGGLAANALADSAFAYLTATNRFTSVGSVLDTGWVVGYLMIALAALWPSARTDALSERAPIDLWQLALPWLAILGAVVAGVVRVLQGVAMDTFLSLDTAAIGGLVMVSQILAHRDSLVLVVQSRASEATLAEVISHAPAAVVRIANDLTIIDSNPRFGPLLGVGESKQAGVPISAYFSPDDGNRMAEQLDSLRSRSKDSVESDTQALRADGSQAWLHWSATAVWKSAGGIDYFVAMFEDTTARHEAEEAASASLRVLEQLNHLKSEFLQSVSHEFKTALIGIQGFSEFMRDADEMDIKDVRAFAGDIYRDAERLDRMVVEMLDLDRVESSRASLRLASVDMNALIQQEIEAARLRVDGITLVSNLDQGLPRVGGDVEKLCLVVRDLLDNAVRYSPDGGTVTVSTKLSAAGVDVSIADEGVGVRADFDNRLFGQTDLYANNPIRKVVGTGLGLGIVRQVVEMHGGRIWVDRLEGRGSAFHFTIPAAVGAKVA